MTHSDDVCENKLHVLQHMSLKKHTLC